MNKYIAAIVVIGFVLSGCVKDDHMPAGPLTINVFPTLTGYFSMTTAGNDTIQFNEFDDDGEFNGITSNSLRIYYLESSISNIKENINTSLGNVDNQSFDQQVKVIIEYRDDKNKLWTSPLIAINQRVQLLGPSETDINSKKILFVSNEGLSIEMFDDFNNSLKIENVQFRNYANMSELLSNNLLEVTL